jgi:hypothetical protein
MKNIDATIKIRKITSDDIRDINNGMIVTSPQQVVDFFSAQRLFL